MTNDHSYILSQISANPRLQYIQNTLSPTPRLIHPGYAYRPLHRRRLLEKGRLSVRSQPAVDIPEWPRVPAAALAPRTGAAEPDAPPRDRSASGGQITLLSGRYSPTSDWGKTPTISMNDIPLLTAAICQSYIIRIHGDQMNCSS